MTKKKYYYYVLVFTPVGPRYVTALDYYNKDAFWNVDDKPMVMTKDNAEFLAVALTWNGNHSVMVTSTYEIEGHPYNYSEYEIKWEKKEDK